MVFRTIFALICYCITAMFAPAFAEQTQAPTRQYATHNIKEVRWAITEWQGLTNRDGTGVYHEVVRRAFAVSDIEISYTYVPLKRAIEYVKTGKADMTGGLDTSNEFLQPVYPINSSKETVFFRKGTLSQDLSFNSLKRKSGVWLLGYTDAFPTELKTVLTGNTVSTRQNAFAMVVNNRADYYLDNDFQMNSLLQAHKEEIDPHEFSQIFLLSLPLYMSFTPGERGIELVRYYETGIEQLLKSGELREIYARWDLDFPVS